MFTLSHSPFGKQKPLLSAVYFPINMANIFLILGDAYQYEKMGENGRFAESDSQVESLTQLNLDDSCDSGLCGDSWTDRGYSHLPNSKECSENYSFNQNFVDHSYKVKEIYDPRRLEPPSHYDNIHGVKVEGKFYQTLGSTKNKVYGTVNSIRSENFALYSSEHNSVCDQEREQQSRLERCQIDDTEAPNHYSGNYFYNL